MKVEDLSSYISFLPDYLNFYVYPIRRKVEPNDTLESLFATLKEIWNILNYHLLEYLITICGTQKLKQRMIQYIYNLDEFKKITLVSNFMECWGDYTDIPDYEEMKVRLKNIQMTLADLDNFREEVKYKCFPFILEDWWSHYKGKTKYFPSILEDWTLSKYILILGSG